MKCAKHSLIATIYILHVRQPANAAEYSFPQASDLPR